MSSSVVRGKSEGVAESSQSEKFTVLSVEFDVFCSPGSLFIFSHLFIYFLNKFSVMKVWEDFQSNMLCPRGLVLEAD